MTHYLRAHHDAILVGVGTVLADDPKLNCRFGNAQIRPVVVDPHGRWRYSRSTLQAVCAHGQGLAPYVVIGTNVAPAREDLAALQLQGGCVLPVEFSPHRAANWRRIVHALHRAGIRSVMVEGGGAVINSMLETALVDSVVVTIGPVFLGAGGVAVSPAAAARLEDVKWWSGVTDSVVAGRLRPPAPGPAT